MLNTEDELNVERTFQKREGPPGAVRKEEGAGAQAEGAAEGAAGAEGAGTEGRGAPQRERSA